MKLVHFTSFDGKKPFSFVANKIVAFAEATDPNRTSIFVLSAGDDSDEFVVGDNYGQVLIVMELAEN